MTSFRRPVALAFTCVALAAAGRENVAFVSAHPDDSYGFAATAMMLGEDYDIHVVDFTYGERGCGEEKYLNGWTKATRMKEEAAACELMGARLHWIGEIDGEAQASPRAVRRLIELFRELKPRAVFTHWPLDLHPDHVQCSAAVQKAILSLPPETELYFFEEYFLLPDRQTMNWHPVYSVDVSGQMERKVKMLRLYACQNANDCLAQNELREAAIRGRERMPACAYAETFATYDGRPVAGGVLESLKQTVRLAVRQLNAGDFRAIINENSKGKVCSHERP